MSVQSSKCFLAIVLVCLLAGMAWSQGSTPRIEVEALRSLEESIRIGAGGLSIDDDGSVSWAVETRCIRRQMPYRSGSAFGQESHPIRAGTYGQKGSLSSTLPL